MKNQSNNPMKWLVLVGMICIFLTLPEIWIAKLITQNNLENFDKCYSVIIFFTACAYIIFSIVFAIRCKKWFKEHSQKTLEESKGKLSSEFTTVLLNSPSDIPKEKCECQAKVDNDGNIICKIHVDFETKIDSYEEFLRYFHFQEE